MQYPASRVNSMHVREKIPNFYASFLSISLNFFCSSISWLNHESSLMKLALVFFFFLSNHLNTKISNAKTALFHTFFFSP